MQSRKMALNSSQDYASQERVSFSDLPDTVIHHIFSFLGYNDLIKVGTLSKRLQQLCMTSPYLYFAYIQRGGYVGRDHCGGFTSFMRRLMAEQRGGGLKVHKIHFKWHCRGCGHLVLQDWLHYFVKRTVEEVVLDLDLDDIELPASLFNSQHLRVLEIRATWDNKLCLPPERFNCLEVLTLHGVVMSNLVQDWISNYCPFLKSLTIEHEDLYGSSGGYLDPPELSIRSSSLEELKIFGLSYPHVKVMAEKLRSLYIDHEDGDDGLHQEDDFMEINAPNIQNLTWIGTPVKLRFTSGLKLRNAIIDVKPKYYGCLFKEAFDEYICPFLFRFLEDLRGVRTLHLSNWLIQLLCACNCIPTGLGSVRHLTLFLRGDPAPFPAPFANELTSLEVLHIKDDFKRNYFIYENPKVEGKMIEELLGYLILIRQVKKVEIELELESRAVPTVEYILKYGRDLETMTVICPSQALQLLSSSVEDFERASSSVAIHLLEI